MKKLLLLVFIIGCSSRETKLVNKENKKTSQLATKKEVITPEKPREKRFNDKRDSTSLPEFIRLFKAVEFDTLHIFSQVKVVPGGSREIRGPQIPKKLLHYFPNYFQGEGADSTAYACYRFNYSSDLTALIANVPSDFEVTAYDFFLYSNKENKIIYSKNIAESSGDSGDGWVEDSWLLDLNKDGITDLVTKSIGFSSDERNEEKTIFSKVRTSVYLGEKNGFKSISTSIYNVESLTMYDYKNLK